MPCCPQNQVQPPDLKDLFTKSLQHPESYFPSHLLFPWSPLLNFLLQPFFSSTLLFHLFNHSLMTRLTEALGYSTGQDSQIHAFLALHFSWARQAINRKGSDSGKCCEASENSSVLSDSLRPMDYTVHGILQARILERVAFPFSRGSSQPMDRTQVSHIAGRCFISWATRETW